MQDDERWPNDIHMLEYHKVSVGTYTWYADTNVINCLWKKTTANKRRNVVS